MWRGDKFFKKNKRGSTFIREERVPLQATLAQRTGHYKDFFLSYSTLIWLIYGSLWSLKIKYLLCKQQKCIDYLDTGLTSSIPMLLLHKNGFWANMFFFQLSTWVFSSIMVSISRYHFCHWRSRKSVSQTDPNVGTRTIIKISEWTLSWNMDVPLQK